MDITLTSFSGEYNDAEMSDTAYRIEVITAGSFTLIYVAPKIAVVVAAAAVAIMMMATATNQD